MAMTKMETGKTVVIILLLNIILPTADKSTDLMLIVKLYRVVPLASAMLIPFCLNYIICFIAFFRLGTDKKKTFIFPLLNLYPQFEAARVILAIIRDPETGIQMKSLYEQNVGLFENFLESAPTTFILINMWFYDNAGGTSLGASFYLTSILSFFSACLGFAKCLKYGVARPIAPGGPVDGLLSGRFILAFIVSGCCLIMKGAFSKGDLTDLIGVLISKLLLAILTTLDLRSRNSLGILISHPSLILLPVFTFFTFSKIKWQGDRRVKFSVTRTLNNVGWCTGYMIPSVIRGGDLTGQFGELTGTGIVLIVTFILSHFFTFFFLYMDLCCCLTAPEQLSVFDPDQPEKTFIYEKGQVVEVKEVAGNAIENNIPREENEQAEEMIP